MDDHLSGLGDRDRYPACEMAKKPHESKWQSFMEELEFLTAHQTLLSYLHFEGARPAKEAPARARSWAGYTGRPVQGLNEYEFAIDDMLARDLLWIVDSEKQTEIDQFVSNPKAIGPIDIMPPIGTLQYSVRLANLFDKFWGASNCSRPTCVNSPQYLTDNSINVYSVSAEDCLQFIHESGMIEAHSLGRNWTPTSCGPWRDQWWRFYDSGFILKVPAKCRITE